MKLPDTFSVLKAVLAVVVLVALTVIVNLDAIVTTLAGARSIWIAAALALLPANLFLETLTWHRLVLQHVPAAHISASFRGILCGHALGVFTPARAGEFAGRAFSIPNAGRWTLAGFVLTQRLLDMSAAMSVGAGALIYFTLTFEPDAEIFWWSAACVGIALALILILLFQFPAAGHRMLLALVPFERPRRGLGFLKQLEGRKMRVPALLVLLRYGVYISQFVLLVRALAPSFRPLTAYLGACLVYFAKFLIPPVTLFDLGIREGAAVFFFDRLGYEQAVAFDAALLLFCINLVLPALAGVPFLLRMRLRDSTR